MGKKSKHLIYNKFSSVNWTPYKPNYDDLAASDGNQRRIDDFAPPVQNLLDGLCHNSEARLLSLASTTMAVLSQSRQHVNHVKADIRP